MEFGFVKTKRLLRSRRNMAPEAERITGIKNTLMLYHAKHDEAIAFISQ